MTSREFEKYFRKLYLPLGMYALRILNDAEAAEDRVMDVFAKVWQKVSDGVEIRDAKQYLYQGVRNGCISYLRTMQGRVEIEEMPEVDSETIDTSERDAAIWKAIDDLPAKCRMIFLLSKRDGLSNQEIADELGISIKTVKNQMTKAFSRLRQSLSKSSAIFFLPFL